MIIKLNREGYAGFLDWRLPTLDEAMSLVEPEQKHGDLYIDSIFDSRQSWIWTADHHLQGTSFVWMVDFYDGNCSYRHFNYYTYVRAVRSVQSSTE